MKVNAVVQHNGDVLYVPPGIFKSICPFDIAAFPFVRLAARTTIFGILFSPVFRIHKYVRSNSARGPSTIQVSDGRG